MQTTVEMDTIEAIWKSLQRQQLLVCGENGRPIAFDVPRDVLQQVMPGTSVSLTTAGRIKLAPDVHQGCLLFRCGKWLAEDRPVVVIKEGEVLALISYVRGKTTGVARAIYLCFSQSA